MSKSLTEVNEFTSPNILKMITSPRKQFGLILHSPKIFHPLLIVSLITILSGIILFQGIDLTSDPTLQGATGRELFDIQSFNIMNSIFIVLFTVVLYTLIHLLAAKVVKSPVSIVQLISMNAHIAIIPALGMLLNAVLFYIFKDSTSLDSFTTLSNFISSDGLLKAALGPFEVFMIWQFILMAIGLQKLASFPKIAAWVIILIFFFLLVSLEMTAVGSGLVQ